MKKIIVFVFLLLPTLFCFSAEKTKHSSTFIDKDVFQSSYFLKNVPGLIPDRNNQPIRYFADHDGVCVFLTDEGMIYKLTEKDEKRIKEIKREKAHGRKSVEDDEEKYIPTHSSFTTVKWVGANPHTLIEATNKNSGYYSFLEGTNAAQLHSVLTDGYAKVVYRNLYPNIDIEYTFPDKGGIKYNIIVRPGGDVSQVQMKYDGDIKRISKEQNGDITIHTPTGDRIEHAPVSYTDDGHQVQASYDMQGSIIRFSLPSGYDHNRTLTIDPWVTTITQLTVSNLGMSVDYDVTGNLFVYGAGAAGTSDLSTYHKLAKFDLSGNLLWVFSGSVAGVWNSALGGWNYLSDAKVDKISGKSYVGEGFNAGIGTQVIRLTSAGVYDNFITAPDAYFEEIWSFVSDCTTGQMFALGGGLNSAINMGLIDPVLATVSNYNMTSIPSPYQQDIVSGTYDAYGSLYVIMASVATLSTNNQIYKVNSTYNGNIWNTPSGYSSFNESANLPAFDNSGNGNTNNFNGLAANSSYLYYYDGYNLKAFNLTTGAVIGTPTTIPGYAVVGQGGIAVDNCNHVYCGGQGVIKTFTFNGSTFTPGADISLGAAFSGNAVNDVRYNSTNNLLYVAGAQVAGTFVATPSITCSVVNTFSAVVSPNCTGASVQVTPGAGLINPVYSYLWQDGAGNIIKQTAPGTSLTDSIAGAQPGVHTVQIQLNVNCGGAALTDTFNINCNNNLTTSDTTICAGQSATLSATGTPTGGTYLWMPGGATTPSITVAPGASTVYAVTYTPPGMAAVTDSAHVTIIPNVTVAVNDTSICNGQNATLTATSSAPGGTYSWAPGGATTQSITVSPSTNTTYTVTYHTNNCGTPTNTGTVTITPAPTVSVNNATMCFGQNATLTATPSIAGGTYLWSPGGATTQSITVSPASNTTYTVTYDISGCGTATNTGTVTVTPDPTVAVSNATICSGQSTTLTANPSLAGGTYLWSPGGATTQSITVSPTTYQNYTVVYTIAGCGTANDTGAVTVQPLPVLTVTSDTVCRGSNATITVTSTRPGGGYTWTPGGATTASITVAPNSTTAYSVSYLLAGCAAVNGSGTVKVDVPPTLSVTNATICNGNTTSLTATPMPGGGTYLWSPGGQTMSTITVSPTITTVYPVSYTAPQSVCPTITTNDTVFVTPAPTVSVLDTTICFGQSATRSAVVNRPGGTYLWSPGGATTQSITVSPTTYTNYTVVYTIAGCGTATDTGAVTVQPLPVLTVTNDTICEGNNATLSVTTTRPGGGYTWTPGGATTASITVAPNSTTAYSVSYLLAGCAAVNGSGTVKVDVPPTLSVTNATICNGNSTSLTATPMPGGGTYLWSTGGQTTASITASPSITTVYPISYTAPQSVCPAITARDTVFVTPAPTVSVSDTTICFGQSATRSAVVNRPGGTYLWSPGGATTQSITVSPTTYTNYTVVYTMAGCGTATDTGAVTVQPLPVLTVTNDTICEGNNATLSVTTTRPGGGYTWTPGGANTASITVAPNSTTAYSVSYLLAGCAAVNGSGTAKVDVPPTLSVTNATICDGNSTSLTATPMPGGGTYIWSPGGQTTSTITVSPTVTTVYPVSYTAPQSVCPAITARDTVFVTPAPTVSVSDTTICFGQSTTPSAVVNRPGGTYLWSPGGATTQSITVSPTTYTNYTVVYTIAGCGTATDTGAVTVQPLPVLTVTNDTVCQGNNATLAVTTTRPGGGYTWTPGGSNTPSITVAPNSTTTYSVSYLLAGCAAVTGSGTAQIDIPATLPVNNVVICNGNSATLTATPTIPGGTYLWSTGGQTTASITASPSITTAYPISYTAPQSVCPTITTYDTVFVVPAPTVSVADVSICPGASAILTATATQSGGTYSWSPGNSTSQSIVVSPSANTTYTVTYVLNTCPPTSDSGTVNIYTSPIDTIIITNAICTSANGQAVSQASGGAAPYTYIWSDALNTVGGTLSGLYANTQYTVTVTDSHQCTVSETASIGQNINQLNFVLDSLSDITCPGLQNGQISLHISNCNSCSYVWNNNSTSDIQNGLAPGIYTVTATDQYGCTNTASYTIQEPPQATLTILPMDSTITEGISLTLNPVFGPFPTSSIVSYSWTPAAGLSCSDCPEPVFSSSAGQYQYSLLITYNRGCTVSDSVNVIVISQHHIYVPNSFTPNGDGVNDVFYAFPVGEKIFNMKIFNRWGEKVFESEDPAIGWDGQFKAQLQEPGVFVYEIYVTFDDGYTGHNKGSVTLIR